MTTRARVLIAAATVLLLGILAATAVSNRNRSLSETGPVAVQPAWETDLRRIEKGLNEVFMAPNPARVGEFADPAGPRHAELTRILTELQASGHRYDGPTTSIGAPQTTGDPATGRLEVQATVVSPRVNLKDASGNTIRTVERQEFDAIYVLTRQSNGVWLILEN